MGLTGDYRIRPASVAATMSRPEPISSRRQSVGRNIRRNNMRNFAHRSRKPPCPNTVFTTRAGPIYICCHRVSVCTSVSGCHKSEFHIQTAKRTITITVRHTIALGLGVFFKSKHQVILLQEGAANVGGLGENRRQL